MAKYKVDITGINTNELKVLKNNEIIELFFKYQGGDLSKKEDLVNGNLKLVLSILRKFSNKVDNLDDLFQIGCVGLLKAIDNFDLSHEVKFSTYAVPMILGEIRRHLRDSTSIRVARSIKDIAYKALKMKEQLTNELGKEPTIKMIAEKLELTESEVAMALDSTKDTISMYEPIYNDGGDTIYLADQLDDKKEAAYPIEMRIALKDAIQNLKDKEKYILVSRYFVGKTQLELAEEIGISQAQISRLEKSGLEKIKKMIN